MMAAKGDDQDELCGLGPFKTDQRVEVDTDPNVHPSVHILRIRTEKKCACCNDGKKFSQGTCFLVDNLQGDDSPHRHFFTAGHVLFCPAHGQPVGRIQLFTSTGLVVAELPSKHQAGWYGVNPVYMAHCHDPQKRRAHDYGVIVLQMKDIQGKFVSQSEAFKVPDTAVARVECMVTGYPVTVTQFNSTVNLNTTLYEDGGWVTPVNEYQGHTGRLYIHFIDTSGGQSGSPVYAKEANSAQKTAIGIHVGWGVHKGPANGKPDCNLCVVLDRERLREVVQWKKDALKPIGNGSGQPSQDESGSSLGGARGHEDEFASGEFVKLSTPIAEVGAGVAPDAAGKWAADVDDGTRPGALEPSLGVGGNRITSVAAKPTDTSGQEAYSFSEKKTFLSLQSSDYSQQPPSLHSGDDSHAGAAATQSYSTTREPMVAPQPTPTVGSQATPRNLDTLQSAPSSSYNSLHARPTDERRSVACYQDWQKTVMGLSKDFADRRYPIVFLLLGVEDSAALDRVNRDGTNESRILREALDNWASDHNGTGQDLYDCLYDAGCPRGTLSRYRKALKVQDGHEGGHRLESSDNDGKFLPRTNEGVDFLRESAGRPWHLRELVFTKISFEFTRYESAIARLLLEPTALELIKDRKWAPTFTGADLLRQALVEWYKSEKNPTGKQLFDALHDAGCPRGILGKYKRLLKLRDSYTGPPPLF